MTTLARPLGYAPGVQQLTWQGADDTLITVHMWGGGGGGGGNDRFPGGTGSGGGYSRVEFTVDDGDTIAIAVGGGGGAGVSGRGSAAGGSAGASAVTIKVFDTRSGVTSPPVISGYTNTNWCTFLNTYGVWSVTQTAGVFDRTYSVTFPSDGEYTFIGSCDNYGDIYFDGIKILHMPGFNATYSIKLPIIAGTYSLRITGTNTGGPGGVALTITGGTSFSGARGGRAGPAGSSGGGGGGGGATVVFKNGTMVGLAAGGGGGGGGGVASSGAAAPGTRGQASTGVSNGQDGTDKAGDGGGGGGGGGGLGGGNGGTVPSGDQGGYAGVGGLSSGNFTQLAFGRTPGGIGVQYYPGAAGYGGIVGGAGAAGAAVMVVEVGGTFVNVPGQGFVPTKKTWINNNGTWLPVDATFIKSGGTWVPVLGAFTPTFELITNYFGVESRVAEPDFVYTPEYTYDSDGSISYYSGPGGYVTDSSGNPVTDGSGNPVTWGSGPGTDGGDGGGGGGKIVCTAMNEAYGFGSFRNRVWIKYARDHLTKAHEIGYHTIFLPLVNYGYKQGNGITHRITRSALEHIARHRGADLRAEMRGTKRDTLGRMYRGVLEPLCWIVGKIKGY